MFVYGIMLRLQISTGLHEFGVYMKLFNIDFDDRKLKKFGENLGLSSTTVKNILIENREEAKAVIALAIFTTWKSNISIKDDDIARETLDDVIKDITQYESILYCIALVMIMHIKVFASKGQKLLQ